MTLVRMLAGCTAVAVAAFSAGSTVSAHDPDFVLGGVGTATIDGAFAPGEWANAGTVSFDAVVPEGGTTPVTLMVMNDATNLYVAFKVQRVSFGGATNPSLTFDNAHDGGRSQGDDGFGMSVGVFQAASFIDFFTDLVPEEIHAPRDHSAGGTNDGSAAATNDGSFTYIEMAHPLDSTDDAHDFTLSAGDVVGFLGVLRIFDLDPMCNTCFADTVFAGDGTNPQQNPRGDIAILSSSPGSCHSAAAEWRRTFVDECVAAGGSPASCSRTGTEIMLSLARSCP